MLFYLFVSSWYRSISKQKEYNGMKSNTTRYFYYPYIISTSTRVRIDGDLKF